MIGGLAGAFAFIQVCVWHSNSQSQSLHAIANDDSLISDSDVYWQFLTHSNGKPRDKA